MRKLVLAAVVVLQSFGICMADSGDKPPPTKSIVTVINMLTEIQEIAFPSPEDSGSTTQPGLTAEDRAFIDQVQKEIAKYQAQGVSDPYFPDVLTYTEKLLAMDRHAQAVRELKAETKVPVQAIFDKLTSISQNYGDVPSPVDCRKVKLQSEAIICNNPYFTVLDLLSARAQVYAVENATKSEVNRKTFKTKFPSKCNDDKCLYSEYQNIVDEALAGESPFETDQGDPAADRLQPTDISYGGLTIRVPEFIVDAAQNAIMRNGKDVGTDFEFDEGSMRQFQVAGQVKPISALLDMQPLRRVTYRVDESGWAVLSGFPDASEKTIYYGACRKTAAKTVCIDFTYDKGHRDIMDKVVKDASLSLKR